MDTFVGWLDDFTNQQNVKDTFFGGQTTVWVKFRIHTAMIYLYREVIHAIMVGSFHPWRQ
jgi:hypothetical protein